MSTHLDDFSGTFTIAYTRRSTHEKKVKQLHTCCDQFQPPSSATQTVVLDFERYCSTVVRPSTSNYVCMTAPR